jgi:glycerol-1-phosphate dehydrogenase [NAD(P)+]
MDLAVLAAAPTRMIRSGLGDSLCRPTAQADWLLAHLLLDQPYREAPFRLLAGDEAELLAAPEALLNGDPAAMERLARTLVMSGFGMTLCGSSHPASQGEHLISHYLDMLGDPEWPESFHGEHIAVTTLTMARLQETLLAGSTPELCVCALDEAAFIARYGRSLGESCWASFRSKCLTAQRALELNQRLAADWPDIRARIGAIVRSSAELEAVLRLAGAPTRPTDLGIPEAAYRDAVLHAREIRDRYTFLDLAADSGRLAGWSESE